MVARFAIEDAFCEGKLSGDVHNVVRETKHGRVLPGAEQVLGDQRTIGQKFTERVEQPRKPIGAFPGGTLFVRARASAYLSNEHAQSIFSNTSALAPGKVTVDLLERDVQAWMLKHDLLSISAYV